MDIQKLVLKSEDPDQDIDILPEKRIHRATVETAGKPVVTITSPKNDPATFILEIEEDAYVVTFRDMVNDISSSSYASNN